MVRGQHSLIFDTKDHPELCLTELESSLISKSLVFMKLFKKPKSRMAAIKDRCVCVPIDDQTVTDTLKQLPRTPSEACIVVCEADLYILMLYVSQSVSQFTFR